MRIDRVFVRFFKGFNYDYELAADGRATVRDWEETGLGWMPYVSVRLEPDVTAVVGANETGKTQLIEAVRHLLTGEGIRGSDFCRYSPLFSVQKDEMRLPDFGGLFTVDRDAEQEVISGLGLPLAKGEQFAFYRPGEGSPWIATPNGDGRVDLDAAALALLEGAFPRIFQITTRTGLPRTVPMDVLADPQLQASPLSRGAKLQILNSLNNSTATATAEAFAKAATQAYPTMKSETVTAEVALARQLLLDVAELDPAAFGDMMVASTEEKDGHVSGLAQRMNAAIESKLNFSRWWGQDRKFQLRITPSDTDLRFTIADRTGTEYSFDERSTGLSYFLSYYVQLLAFKRVPEQSVVLLLDEPDAYLSSSGQQDLLRILENWACPEDGSRQDQVVYVTHSPFLIDKNAGHRIRVLDKGEGDEGTRVVRDATRNHYEPLRSAIGSYVAETAFIGGSNLFVEGAADQVLLVGMSGVLRRQGETESDLLNLNDVTVVPAGGTGSIPYLVYLARGRDQVRPPCVALLDGDTAGLEAAEKLRRSEVSGERIVPDDQILVLSAWAADAPIATDARSVLEIEDLVRLEVLIAAAQNYAQHLLGLPKEEVQKLSVDKVKEKISDTKPGVYDALKAEFKRLFKTSVDKVGLAKEVIALADAGELADSGSTLKNFQSLLAYLFGVLRRASEIENEGRENRRFKEAIGTFIRQHPNGARKDAVSILLGRLAEIVATSASAEVVGRESLRLAEKHRLEIEPNSSVADWPNVSKDLKALKYARRLQDQGGNAAALD